MSGLTCGIIPTPPLVPLTEYENKLAVSMYDWTVSESNHYGIRIGEVRATLVLTIWKGPELGDVLYRHAQ